MFFYCNSNKVRLIRAADIIANHAYKEAIMNKGVICSKGNTFLYYLPSNYIKYKGLEYFRSKIEN